MEQTTNLELISFNICPFVQRSVIALNEKGTKFKTTYVDLANLPDWFKQISPMGKVPVLKAGDTPIFESMVIAEYLDEVYGPNLHPQDPIMKAQHRSWIEYSSELIMTQYYMFIASNEDDFEGKRQQLATQLDRLNSVLDETGPMFSGQQFCLIDAAFAPIFMRIDIMNRYMDLNLYAKDSRIDKWSISLMSRKSVKNSVSHDFENAFIEYFRHESEYMNQIIGKTSKAS